MRPARTRVSAVAIALVSLPAAAYAGGFEIGDNGTRALGRAGAYAASADEPSAIYYNPAALTRVRGTHATLNLHLFDNNTTFQRDPFIYEDPTSRRDPEREIRFEEVEQQTPIFPAPMAFASTNFGLEGWTFGVGAYGPSAFGSPSYHDMTRRPQRFDGATCGVYQPCNDDRNTPEDESIVTRDGGQAYMMVEQSVLLVYPSLSVARLFERADLSIGITAQLAALFVDFEVGVDGDGSQPTDVEFSSIERDDFFVPNRLDVKGLSATGILGVLWEPSDRIAVGASYRPQFGVVGRGTIDIEFPPGLAGAGLSLTDNDATLRFRMPDVVRGGVAYTHRNETGKELFDLELDVVWENWSVMQYFDVDIPGKVDDTAGTLRERNIPRLRLGRYYEDSVSIRLGSDISTFLDAEGHGPIIRAGIGYETPSSPEEWTNIDFTPFTRVTGSLGFSWHVGRVSIDAAYAYVWSPTRKVDNGEYELLTPLWICEDPSGPLYPGDACNDSSLDPSHTVNNGTYETWSQIFSIGTTYGW